RLPRRHDPSLHARGHARARRARGVPGAAAHAGPRAGRDHRRRADPHRGLRPSAGALPVHRPHAAVGLPRLPRGPRPALPRVRAAAGLRGETLGAPMDVLWFRLPRKPGDAGQLLGRVEAGRIFIMLDRGDYWQCGFVIAKGTLDEIRARGLAAFRDEVARLADARAEASALRDWEDVKLLTV